MAVLLIASLIFIATFSDQSELLGDESDESCFMCFRRFVFLWCFFILDFLHLLSSSESYSLLLLDLLHLLSSDESDLIDDESDKNGSESRSSGTCSFPFRFDDPVGHVSGLGYSVFVPTGVESKCDVFAFVVFISI